MNRLDRDERAPFAPSHRHRLQLLEETRLADAGLAQDDYRRSVPAPRFVETLT
jgi:hypothetical protein